MHVLSRYPIIFTTRLIFVINSCKRACFSSVVKGDTCAPAFNRVFPLPLAITFGFFTFGNTFLHPSYSLNFIQELIQTVLRDNTNIRIIAAQELEQTAQEFWEVGYEFKIWDGVEEGDPTYKEGPSERVDDPYSLF